MMDIWERVSSVFTGGTLDEDDKDIFFQNAIYMDSKKNAKSSLKDDLGDYDDTNHFEYEQQGGNHVRQR